MRLTTVSDTTVVITLTGELDTTTAPVLAATLGPLAESPIIHVIVAAGDLWFCDLTGLDHLAAAHKALYAKGGGLAVAEAGPALCRLIGLVTEHSRAPMAMYDTMREALAEVGIADDEPPNPERRHLPRLRRVPRGQAPRQSLRQAPRQATRARQRSDHLHLVSPPPAPPARADGDEPAASPGRPYRAMARSRALREEARWQVEALEQRIRRSDRARQELFETRARCYATISTVRATVAKANQALATITQTVRNAPG
ncbi:STAS domain-containing protein [Nonomuraea rhizosphaerae]|uniref:STAS domain-containing protein n=1 Tax=Nonomuraea rhizosphaerae TaxID=2665663 RepID=UPI001C5FD900|nr:STAS domain-containing protein [Nonomuraea rhizosphaerae]